jgi:hypothetical protein
MELVTIRRVILGVLLLGMAGLLVELFLLGHYEDFSQWMPLAVLPAGLVAIGLEGIHRRAWTLRIVKLIMVAFIVIGLLGIYFHFRGSREFQLEMDPSMGGTSLIWHVLRAKSPPTLSPGTLVQMGILGLGYAYLRRTK